MKIMDKLLYKTIVFYEKNHREVERSKCLTRGLCIKYLLVFGIAILLGIIQDLFGKQVIYPQLGVYLISLVIFSFAYAYKKKKDISEEIWTKRQMNAKTLFWILSLYMSSKSIISIAIKTICTINGIDETMLPGTASSVGTSYETMLIAIIFAPIIEELIFRGIGLSNFRKNDNKLEAIILTSITFGLCHGNWAQAISAGIGGLICGYVTIEFGIGYSILLHILNNGLVYVEYFLERAWLVEIISAIMVFCCIFYRKDIAKEIRFGLKSETAFSIKRELMYFAHPGLFAFCIVWVLNIITSI